MESFMNTRKSGSRKQSSVNTNPGVDWSVLRRKRTFVPSTPPELLIPSWPYPLPTRPIGFKVDKLYHKELSVWNEIYQMMLQEEELGKIALTAIQKTRLLHGRSRASSAKEIATIVGLRKIYPKVKLCGGWLQNMYSKSFTDLGVEWDESIGLIYTPKLPLYVLGTCAGWSSNWTIGSKSSDTWFAGLFAAKCLRRGDSIEDAIYAATKWINAFRLLAKMCIAAGSTNYKRTARLPMGF
jgi:hypothetical protein